MKQKKRRPPTKREEDAVGIKWIVRDGKRVIPGSTPDTPPPAPRPKRGLR